MRKMLVVYFSQSCGNTKEIAEQLHLGCGADIARIETVEEYPSDYNELVEQGKREVDGGCMPRIYALDRDIGEYDVVAVGTPVWWYTMAPAVRTFFSEYDLTGKTVVPFATHGGWPKHVLRDMRKACRGATVRYEMDVRFDSDGGKRMETPKEVVSGWVNAVKSMLTGE